MDQNKPGILDIPMEMLEKIFTQLYATDILSCTKVCKQFWLATKKNSLWEKICERICDTSKYVIDYVNTVPSTVEPIYSPPREILASVCEWRRVYMRLIQLKRNFINGVYKNHFITYYLGNAKSQKIVVLNDLLILYNIYRNKVQVWNVRFEPRLVGTIVGALRNVATEVFCITDNIVAVLQGTVLQVYKINESGDITRMYRRLVKGKNNSDIPETENIDRWYRTQRRPEYISLCVTGEYFICVVRLGVQIMLYQWNIKTGRQVHVAKSNILSLHFVTLIGPETYSGDILVVVFIKTTNLISSVLLYRYNLESHLFQYLFKVYTKYKPFICYENNKIVVLKASVFSNKLTIHNLPPRSVDMPARVSFYSYLGITVDSFIMSGNIVSYILGQILIIKNNSLNDIYHISLVNKHIEHVTPTCMFCDWNIVLVLYLNVTKRVSVIELHDIIAKTCIKTVDYNGLVCIYRCSPVSIIVENLIADKRYINLLQFW